MGESRWDTRRGPKRETNSMEGYRYIAGNAVRGEDHIRIVFAVE
jgi:hypothetical protein